jgi:hypothetical protein
MNVRHEPGANPTNARYNATSSLMRFEEENIFFHYEKRSSLLLAV